jgi:hypothetical protein
MSQFCDKLVKAREGTNFEVASWRFSDFQIFYFYPGLACTDERRSLSSHSRIRNRILKSRTMLVAIISILKDLRNETDRVFLYEEYESRKSARTLKLNRLKRGIEVWKQRDVTVFHSTEGRMHGESI